MMISDAPVPVRTRSESVPRPLTIFVPHGSQLLTDHLPHGDGLVAHGFISELAARGHHLVVAVPRADLLEPLPPSVELHVLEGKRSAGVANSIDFLIRARRLYAATARRRNVDIIHQLNPVVRGISLSLVGTRRPIVLGTYVGDWEITHPDLAPAPPSFSARALSRLKAVIDFAQQSQAAALLVTTPYALNRIPHARRLRDRTFQVLHGVDERRFFPCEQRRSDPPSVLFLATMERYKGVFTLLDAFERVAPKLTGVTLRLAGAGADAAQIKERIARCRFRNRIEFLGPLRRDRVAEELRRSEVLCLPSYSEPFAQVVLEAMASGLAVVIASAGGTKYMVPEQGGLRVPPGDPEALADALIELLSSRSRCEAMGQSNRELVLQRYTWPKVVDRLESLYAYVLGFRADPPPRLICDRCITKPGVVDSRRSLTCEGDIAGCGPVRCATR